MKKFFYGLFIAILFSTQAISAPYLIPSLAVTDPNPAIDYLSPLTGSAARTYESKFSDSTNVLDFPGCDPTGTTDSTACVQAAVNSLSFVGGRVDLIGKYRITGLTVPAGVTVRGDCVMPGTIGSNTSTPYGNLKCGVLEVPSTGTISMGAGSGLKSLLIYRDGMTFPAPDSSAFAGTAITAAGDDVSVDHVMVLGFNKAFYSTGFQRARISYLYGDNNNGIEIADALDIPYIDHCHMWPFATIATGGSYTNSVRSGTAYYLHDTTDWAKISDSFSWGYAKGIDLVNANSVTVLNSGADNAYSTGPDYAGSNGIIVEGTSSDVRLIGVQASAQANAGILIATSAGATTTISNSNIWGGSTHGILVNSGDVIISDDVFGGLVGLVNGITVNSSASKVIASSNKFETISGNPINNPVASSLIFLSNNDFGSFTGQIGNSSWTSQTVASADPLVLPNHGDTFTITGTTGFGSLEYGWPGRVVTLIFTGALTVTSATGSSVNMRLNSNTNIPTAAGTTLTLRFNGTQWYQIGESN